MDFERQLGNTNMQDVIEYETHSCFRDIEMVKSALLCFSDLIKYGNTDINNSNTI